MLFHFSTVVWGPWHTGAYLDVNLPSLLASNNLAAFAKQHQVVYRIFTSPADRIRIMASPAFQRASEIIQIEVIERVIDGSMDPIAMHHALWRHSIERAKAAGAMILFIPPDVIWSNGSFGHVADLASQGKRAIFMTYLRVVSETVISEVRRRFAESDSPAIDAPSRELVDVAMRHIHPLTLTYLRDSPLFPIHPEFILWTVPGEGLLMRVLVREMFAYDPNLFELNQQSLLAYVPDRDLVHYISDSDDLFSLSLAPLMKDIEWYAKPQQLDHVKIGKWWLTYDSPANDIVSNLHFYIHLCERTPDKWRRAELESDFLMQNIEGTREILRVLNNMTQSDVQYARQMLALALARTKVAHFLSHNIHASLVLPNNTAILGWMYAAGESLLQDGKVGMLPNLILDHILPTGIPAKPDHPRRIRTARGGTRLLTWQDDTPYLDGVKLRTPRLGISAYSAYVSDEILPPSSLSSQRRLPDVSASHPTATSAE